MSFDLTVFEELTARLGPMPSVFEAMWVESEDMLRESCPDGYDVLQIGRTAWDCLPDEAAREAALDEMFYAYWEAMQDRAARAGQTGSAS